MAFLDQRDGVTVVRAERLIEPPRNSAWLEMRDVWVDTKNLGATMIRKLEVELTRVSPTAAPIAVYAYRTGDDVHMIVPTPSGSQYDSDDSDRWGNTNCDHMRYVLRPDATGKWTFLVVVRREIGTTRVRIEAARKGAAVAARMD